MRLFLIGLKKLLKNHFELFRGDSHTRVFNPAPDELDNLLPRILGAAAVGDVFDVAETLPSFTVFIDKVGDIFQYDDCKCNRATFRASAGGLPTM